jgi:hypothetical protein
MFLLRKKKDAHVNDIELEKSTGHITKITVEKPGEVEKTDDMVDQLLVKVNQKIPPAGEATVQTAASPIPAVKSKDAVKAPEPGIKAETPVQGTPKPLETKPEKSTLDSDNLFANLFAGTDEPEETPKDRLVNSLPDIGIEEVITESQEVQSIIDEWQQNSHKEQVN